MAALVVCELARYRFSDGRPTPPRATLRCLSAAVPTFLRTRTPCAPAAARHADLGSLQSTGTSPMEKGRPMLVLSRKINEEIVIDGSIRIKVIEVNGSHIKLGITAPHEIPVHRAEVYLAL